MAYYWKDNPEYSGKAEAIVRAEVQKRGMTIKSVSQAVGIPYKKLQPSLSGYRHLNADEFLRLCAFLKIDPRAAAEHPASA